MSTELLGGLGGVKRGRLKNVRLLERALAEGWDVPADLRAQAVQALSRVLSDPGASRRELTSAASAVISATRVNVEVLKVGLAAAEHDRRADEAGRLDRLFPALTAVLDDEEADL